MDTNKLRQKILDMAIRGKLVPQDPNDEPASVLLERIRNEKQRMVQDEKKKKRDIKNDTIIFRGDDNLHYEKFSNGSVKCIEDEIPFDTASRIYKDIIFDTSPVAGKMYKNSENRRKQGVSCGFRCICRCSICPVRAQPWCARC